MYVVIFLAMQARRRRQEEKHRKSKRKIQSVKYMTPHNEPKNSPYSLEFRCKISFGWLNQDIREKDWGLTETKASSSPT